MRLLVDEGVDVRVMPRLARAGHAVRRVPRGATNGTVIALARREGRILITRDADFTNARLYPSARHAGIIHLAIHPPWLEKILPPLMQFLHKYSEDELRSRVAVLGDRGHHFLPSSF